MNTFLRFKPLYHDRVWGGRNLESALGRLLPPVLPIGESWEIVDRPEAQSVVVGGEFDGKTLRQVIAARTDEVMGPQWPADKPFPILVKWLDCKERLSLQVHPPAAIAPALRGEPKTENWYIAASAPGSHLIVGLKKGVTRDQFKKAIGDLTLDACVHRFPVKAGDSILVHSGQIHAIDAGNLILEIQQNSDTTYRVYDWGRVGLDGKPRQMHVEQSLQSIHWDDFEPSPLKGERKWAVIADAKEFRIRRVPLTTGETLSFGAHEQPRILSVVEGSVVTPAGEVLMRGDNVILPFSVKNSFNTENGALVLVTDNF